jgi:short-subunit dehydrogenase
MSEKGTALITGASEGIGYELTKLFAQDGYDLVLVARNEKKLNEIADDMSRTYGIDARVISKDLAKPDAPEEIYSELSRDGVAITALVNNAGYLVYGPFAEHDISEELDMLQVLVTAPTKLTGLFVKDMLRADNGRILNVGSVGSFVPGPFTAVYSAAKSYILFFSHALAEELRGSNVTVTTVCPGSTRTQFASRGKVENVLGNSFATMSAQKVAAIAYKALMKNKRHVVTGMHNKIIITSGRMVPISFQTKVSKLFMS